MVYCKEFAGLWQKMPIIEQLAHIGSEVGRALNWRAKGKPDSSRKAFNRALELVDLTIDGLSDLPKLKEIMILRVVLKDYFLGKNEFGSTYALWRKYFSHFSYAVRKNH